MCSKITGAKISISEFMVIFFIDVQIFVAFGGHV